MLARPAQAQGGIQIQTDEATPNFPGSIDFHLVANSRAAIDSVVLHYGTNGRTCQSGEARQVVDFDHGPTVDTHWAWELKRSGSLPPGVQVWWQWEIHDASGAQITTEKQSLRVEDARYSWRTLTCNHLTLIWSEGDNAFGAALMDEAQRSLDRLATDMGVRPPGDVWITVYPTAEDIRGAILHQPEWTGGLAFPEYGSVVMGILPGEDEWAAQVIPHELAHLVVGALVFNCLGVDLPTWLDEGLARYSEGAWPNDERDVRQALDQNALPPLRTLANGFPADEDRARLAYAQSGQIVQFMIQTYGPDKMSALLAAMQSGKKIDPALREGYSFDTDGLDAAWRISMGAAALPTVQPTSTASVERTPVPTFALWTAVPVAAAATPTASPPPPDTPRPTLASPTLPTAPSATAAPPADTRQPSFVLPLLLCGGMAVVLLLVVTGVVFAFFVRRRGA